MAALARSRVASGLAVAGAASVSHEISGGRNSAECRGAPRQVTGPEVNECAKMIFMPSAREKKGNSRRSSTTVSSSAEPFGKEEDPDSKHWPDDLGPHGRFAHDTALAIALDPSVQQAIFDRLPLSADGHLRLDALNVDGLPGGCASHEVTDHTECRNENFPRSPSYSSSLSSDTQCRGDVGGVGAAILDDPKPSSTSLGPEDDMMLASFEDEGFPLFDDDQDDFEDDDADYDNFRVHSARLGGGAGGVDLALRELKREVCVLREELDEQRTLNEQLVYQNSDLQDQLRAATRDKDRQRGEHVEEDPRSTETTGRSVAASGGSSSGGGSSNTGESGSSRPGPSSSALDDEAQRQRLVQRGVAFAVRGAVAATTRGVDEAAAAAGEEVEEEVGGHRRRHAQRNRAGDPTTNGTSQRAADRAAGAAAAAEAQGLRSPPQRRSASQPSSKNQEAAEAVIRGAVLTLATTVVIMALVRRCHSHLSASSGGAAAATAAAAAAAAVGGGAPSSPGSSSAGATVAALKFHESALASSAYSAFAAAMRTAASFAERP